MTDFNWNDPRIVAVAAKAVNDEAPKWFAKADAAQKLAGVVMGLTLDQSAFMVVDPTTAATAAALKKGYDEIYQHIVTLLVEAAAEFEQLGCSLKASSSEYAHSDSRAEARMRGIW
jgi:hypothetical protein